MRSLSCNFFAYFFGTIPKYVRSSSYWCSLTGRSYVPPAYHSSLRPLFHPVRELQTHVGDYVIYAHPSADANKAKHSTDATRIQMTTRPRATVRKTQPRKARSVNVAVSDLSHASNTFAGLPYDVKYHLLHEFHFTPSELLSLSHINRSWRECATADSLWLPWFEVYTVASLTLRLCHGVLPQRDLDCRLFLKRPKSDYARLQTCLNATLSCSD